MAKAKKCDITGEFYDTHIEMDREYAVTENGEPIDLGPTLYNKLLGLLCVKKGCMPPSKEFKAGFMKKPEAVKKTKKSRVQRKGAIKRSDVKNRVFEAGEAGITTKEIAKAFNTIPQNCKTCNEVAEIAKKSK